MKKLFTILLAALTINAATAQTNLGINNPTPDASAALDVTSTTQGMLVPRMTLAQRNAINLVAGVSTPATGLLIYQTDNTAGFYFYNGTAWGSLSGGSSLPTQTGNGGKFLTTNGTTTSWATPNSNTLPTTYLGHQTNTQSGILFVSPFISTLNPNINGVTTWIMPSTGMVTIVFSLYEDEAGTIELFEVTAGSTQNLSITGSALSIFTYPAWTSGAAVTGTLSATLIQDKIYTVRITKTATGAFTGSAFYTKLSQQ